VTEDIDKAYEEGREEGDAHDDCCGEVGIVAKVIVGVVFDLVLGGPRGRVISSDENGKHPDRTSSGKNVTPERC